MSDLVGDIFEQTETSGFKRRPWYDPTGCCQDPGDYAPVLPEVWKRSTSDSCWTARNSRWLLLYIHRLYPRANTSSETISKEIGSETIEHRTALNKFIRVFVRRWSTCLRNRMASAPVDGALASTLRRTSKHRRTDPLCRYLAWFHQTLRGLCFLSRKLASRFQKLPRCPYIYRAFGFGRVVSELALLAASYHAISSAFLSEGGACICAPASPTLAPNIWLCAPQDSQYLAFFPIL